MAASSENLPKGSKAQSMYTHISKYIYVYIYTHRVFIYALVDRICI